MKSKLSESLLAAFLACLLLLTASCSRPTGETGNGSEWTNRDTWLTSGAASKQGYYYLRDDQFLCFFDFASQKSVYLCDKTGCTHRDGDCRSSMLSVSPSRMFFRGDTLYFFETRQDGLKLTRRDADGGNYEEVLTLMQGKQETDATLSLTDFRVCGNLVYYIGSVLKYSDDGRPEGKSYLYQIDLGAGKEELLCELGEDGASLVAARKGQVLLQQNLQNSADEEFGEDYNSREYLSSIPHRVLLWEENTGKLTTLLEDNRWNLLGALAAWDDSYYVIRWDENHETNYVERRSFDGSETETVFSPGCKISDFSIPSDDLLSFILEGARKGLSLPDFAEQDFSFLGPADDVFYATKEGYIIRRVLEYEGDLSKGATFTKTALSYLSFEDAEAGRKNYVDFCIQEYDS